MTPTTRLARRARSAAAALLAALAVLGSLLVGPSAGATAQSVASVAGTASRAAAPTGLAVRDQRDARGIARVGSRRGAREQSAPTAAGSLRSALGQGPAPVTGLAAADLLLGSLVAVGLVRRVATAPARRRTPGARRDRAPPALALA